MSRPPPDFLSAQEKAEMSRPPPDFLSAQEKAESAATPTDPANVEWMKKFAQ
jgi:hypothetical protein